MSRDSTPALLGLHAVRITGFAGTGALARRFDLAPAVVETHLLDAAAQGWVTHAAFGGSAGWSLTERGRAENERQLAAELAERGGAAAVHGVHEAFVPLNARLLRAVTDWQLRPEPGGRLGTNDHLDPAWDGRVLRELGAIGRALRPLNARLTDVLTRFGGYDRRFTAALRRARDGDAAWVDRTDVDSCHRVWFELHEDLLATLGIDRHGQG